MNWRSNRTLPVSFAVLLIVLCLGSSSPVFAQTKSVKILGLSIEGNKTSNANLIRLNSGLSVGTEVSGIQIQKAIKQLWSLGIFSDVKVVLENEVPEGIFIAIVVEEFPRLQKVELFGNKKIKKKDIDKELDFYRGQVITPTRVRRAERKLRDMYREKGYLLAEISHTVRPANDSGERVVLKFNIHEGSKVQVKKISFSGNRAFTDGKLRKQLKETKEDRWWRGADFDQEKYEEDLQKVLDFYRSEGYRDAEVLGDSMWYSEDQKDLYIDIRVRESDRYYFGKLTWEGNTFFSVDQLRPLLNFKEGDLYDKEELDKAVFERLGSMYYDNGYIFAQILPHEKPVAADTVDIHFTIVEGSPVRVNKIYVTGNTKTKEKVVRRELKIRPGDIFSREALIRSQREVWVLNYFSDVKPDVKPTGEEQVDLEFAVEEKSTDTANMSAGWSERDKLIGSIGVSMNNLFGNGQRLSFDWNFGRSFRSFQVSFTEPWLMDTPTLAGFSFYDIKRDPIYIGWRQRSTGGSFRIGRRFRWPDNYFRGDWIYRLDRTELSDFHPNAPRSIVETDWPLISSSITQIISRNSLDRPEFPTSGSEVSLSTEFAGGPFGGNVGFLKHILKTDWFYPTFWNLVLYNSVQVGYIDRLTESSDLPYQELFFIGGAGLSRSVALRGYDDPWVGTVSDPGGQTLVKYSLEYRVPIVDNPTMFGLMFMEAGNTWASLSKTDPYDLKRSVGFGMRVFMPMIGIIGFDYAYGFDNINPSTGARAGQWKPHFVFGRGF